MKVLGIELKHPSPGDLWLAARAICIFSALVVLGHSAGVVDSGQVFPMVIGGAVGVLASTFGASILRYGWRALILIGAIGLLTHAALTLVGVF